MPMRYFPAADDDGPTEADATEDGPPDEAAAKAEATKKKPGGKPGVKEGNPNVNATKD